MTVEWLENDISYILARISAVQNGNRVSNNVKTKPMTRTTDGSGEKRAIFLKQYTLQNYPYNVYAISEAAKNTAKLSFTSKFPQGE